MKIISKTILACSIAATALFAVTSAQAANFNPFTVDPVAPAYANFTADKITGNYTEVATFNPDGTFNVSLLYTAGQFVTGGGTTALSSKTTGLGYDYGLYAVYKASGTVTIANGVTTFNFIPSSTDSLTFFLDTNGDTVTTGLASSGTGSFAQTGTSDDVILATGNPITGLGMLDTSLSTCGTNGINCGSFGASSTFNLTAAGTQFFVAPSPFYSMAFQSGQLNNFTATGTQTINGSLDVVFANEVPEPASLGLLGLGLLGLGFVRGRKQS